MAVCTRGAVLGFAISLIVASAAAVAIAFATNGWIIFTVLPDGYGESQTGSPGYSCPRCPELYFTRSWGLFRTCFGNINDTVLLLASEPPSVSWIDGFCIVETGYELSNFEADVAAYDQAPYTGQGAAYRTSVHLLRTHWGAFVAAMVLLLFAIVVGTAGCWQSRLGFIFATGMLLLLASVCIALGMAAFHFYDNIWSTQMSQAPFYGTLSEMNGTSTYSDLAAHTTRNYNYSYALGWVGLGCAFFAFVLFLGAFLALRPRPPPREDKQALYVSPPPLQASRSYNFRSAMLGYSSNPYNKAEYGPSSSSSGDVGASAGVSESPYALSKGGLRISVGGGWESALGGQGEVSPEMNFTTKYTTPNVAPHPPHIYSA